MNHLLSRKECFCFCLFVCLMFLFLFPCPVPLVGVREGRKAGQEEREREDFEKRKRPKESSTRAVSIPSLFAAFSKGKKRTVYFIQTVDWWCIQKKYDNGELGRISNRVHLAREFLIYLRFQFSWMSTCGPIITKSLAHFRSPQYQF